MARLRTATTSFGTTFRQFFSSYGRYLKTAALLLAAVLVLPRAWRMASGTLFDPPPKPPLHPEVVVTLTSSPAGARVVRLVDGKAAGSTPTREVHLADGSTVEYLFHLGGFVDVQVPIVLDSGGERNVHVNLRPVPVVPSAPSARRATTARTPGRRSSAAEVRPVAPAPSSSDRASAPADQAWDDARPLLPATRVKHLGQR
jgi:hypothetical protein